MSAPMREAFQLCALAAACTLGIGAAGARAAGSLAATPSAQAARAEDGFASGAMPSVNPLVAATLPRYLQARAVALVGWLADGSLLIDTRHGASTQLERLAAPLGTRKALVRVAGPSAQASPRPFGRAAFIYVAPAGQGTQLMLERLGAGAATALTTGGQVDGLPVWAHDDHRIAFVSRGGHSAAAGVYLLDTRTRGSEPQWIAGGGSGAWRVFGWSPDDSALLVGQLASDHHGEYALFLADPDTGSVTALTVPPGLSHGRRSTPVPLLARSARFDPNGEGIVLRSDQDSQFTRLLEFDPNGDSLRVLAPDTDGDVERFTLSPNGRYLAYTVDEEGLSRLRLLDRQSGQSTAVTGLPSGIIRSLAFDQTSTRLALDLETPRTPGDLYVLATGTDRAVLWARSSLGVLRRSRLPEAELVHFPTWDMLPDGRQRQLSAFVYGPGAGSRTPTAVRGAPRRHSGGPHPVLIFLHTGGGAQYRPIYDPLIDYLVDRLGFVVIAPNVRGASGFGADFEALGEGAQRAFVVRDVGALLVWIGLQPELDARHIAIMGESYGAYVALLSLVDYGNRLLGGVVALPAQLPPLENGAGISRPVLLLRGQGGSAVSAGQFQRQLAELRSEAVAAAFGDPSDGAGDPGTPRRAAWDLAAASFLSDLVR